MAGPAASCVGCETQGRPGRSGTAKPAASTLGKSTPAKPAEWQPPRRLSGGACRGCCRQSCGARCRRLGRKCPHLCGHRCTAWCAARCTAKPAPATHEVRRRRAEAQPVAGAAGQGERGEFRDERGAQRRGEEDTAVTLAVPSNMATTVSARHAAVSAANRRASGARSERSERRREGYPPAGSRPL